MRRLPVLAALVVAAIIAASAWLAIDAQSDPQPLPVAEHLPRDDEQAQQQESQPEPNPDPDEQSEDQQSADQEPSDEEASEALPDEEQSEPRATNFFRLGPADILIDALEIERPLVEPAVVAPSLPTLTTYIIEPEDTLADIAARFEVGLDELIAANELDLPDLLQVGQELTIPRASAVALVVEEPEPPPESVEVAPAVTEQGIVYGTIRDHERGVVNSAVIARAQTDSTVILVEACVDGVRRTYIMGLPLSEAQPRIYWRFDGGPLNTDRWNAEADRVESLRWRPLLHTGDEMEGVKTLWVRIAGIDLTFGMEDIVPVEMRYNFNICGR